MQDNYMPLPKMIQLLDQKGFNEAGLQIGWKPNTLANELQLQHLLLQEAALSGRHLNVLVADIPGRFDKGRDRVDFQLVFDYNHRTEAFKLRMMRATLNQDQGKMLYIFGNPQQMYPVNEIVDQLNSQRATKAVEVYQALQAKNNLQKSRHL